MQNHRGQKENNETPIVLMFVIGGAVVAFGSNSLQIAEWIIRGFDRSSTEASLAEAQILGAFVTAIVAIAGIIGLYAKEKETAKRTVALVWTIVLVAAPLSLLKAVTVGGEIKTQMWGHSFSLWLVLVLIFFVPAL